METSNCSFCGNPVDPLRAGGVAWIRGQFAYFCDVLCKRSYLEGHGTTDPTAAPPEVAPPTLARALTPAPPAPSLAPSLASPSLASPSLASPSVATPAPVSVAPRRGGQAPVLSKTPLPTEVSAMPWTDAEASAVETERPQTILDPRIFEETEKESSLPVSATYGAAALALMNIVLGVLPTMQGPMQSLAPLRQGLALVSVIVTLVVIGHPFSKARTGGMLWTLSGATFLLGATIVSLLHPGATASSLASLVSVFSLTYLALHRFKQGRAPAKVPDFRICKLHAYRNGDRYAVESRDITEHDELEITAGEQLPVDVRVIDGNARFELWNGSTMARDVSAGDTLSAGATCLEGSLRVRAIARDPLWFSFPQEAHTIVQSSRIASRIEFALAGSAVTAALVTGAVTFAVTGASLDALVVALSVFFTIPIGTVRTALGTLYLRGAEEARQAGALYTGPMALEHAFAVDTIAIVGRSGLLTSLPERIALEFFPRAGGMTVDEPTLLMWVGEAEQCALESSLGEALAHPHPDTLRKATFHPGRGVQAELLNGMELLLGSRAYLLERGIGTAQADQRAAEIACTGRRLMYIALDGRVVAFMAFDESVRPEARAAVERLYDANVEPVLVSGESQEVCEVSARDLGIDHVRADVAYESRAEEIVRLAEAGRTVSVLGHPAHDLAPLREAHVALLRPSHAHFESRDGVWLLGDDLRTAAFGLAAAKNTWLATRRLMASVAIPAALTALALALGFAPVWAGPLAALFAGSLVMLEVQRGAKI